jgi:SAM-dependent methyltransferase
MTNDPRDNLSRQGDDPCADSQHPLALLCEVAWDSDGARHRDARYIPSVELGLDRLPRELTEALADQHSGFRTEAMFQPGTLLPDWRRDQVLSLPASRFDGRLPGLGVLVPRAGRFYPRRLLSGDGGTPPSGRVPFRVIGFDEEQLTVDLNHPLAGKPLTLSAEIEPSPTNAWPGGGGLDLISALLDDGPGMQGRHDGLATDFFDEDSFTRSDPSDDAGFYRQPRLVDHLDSTAISEISALYGRLIPPRARILDLMSSWHSHLPTTLNAESITGLGMNADELARNTILTERVVHDLNAEPRLPFGEERFDAVVCTVSVEYLTDPLAVFRDLGRVLAPDGVAIMTFSNRWFPPKVIRGWALLHEFERPGLVLEYFHRSNRFQDCHTHSLRGRPRPANDTYSHRLPHSDPVHAVWAFRTG